MALLTSKVIIQSINIPAQKLYDRFWQPEAFAEWASGLTTTGLQKDDIGWKFQGPPGECRMTFTEYNKFGLMDHTVDVAGKQLVYAPMRVVNNGDGCDVQVTLFRQPEMGDEQYQQDQEMVAADLLALKKLAESGQWL